VSHWLTGDSADSEIIPPSSKANKLFDDTQSQYLVEKWQGMIADGHLSRIMMRQALLNDEQGKQILQAYSDFQLMNKLKYERRRFKENRM
jgi:hypothetical protein